MKHSPDDIKTAIDTTLSGASHDPTLYNYVVNASKGDTPTVKRKLTFSLALVLILVLMTGTVAVAATYRGVTWFLTERENKTVDPDYLMDILEQTHNSELLNIRVVDAYWDGAKLSMAINFAPKEAGLSFALYCQHYEDQADHVCRNENNDLLLNLFADDLPSVTIGMEEAKPHHCSYDYYFEEDGSITVMYGLPMNNMSQPVNITDSLQVYLRSSGVTEDVSLCCYLPALTDPIAPHEHDWAPATCVIPETCTICGRTQGGLGKHNFQPEACNVTRTCDICTYTYEAMHTIDPDTGSCYCGIIK